jgi:hypothetical protein
MFTQVAMLREMRSRKNITSDAYSDLSLDN